MLRFKSKAESHEQKGARGGLLSALAAPTILLGASEPKL